MQRRWAVMSAKNHFVRPAAGFATVTGRIEQPALPLQKALSIAAHPPVKLLQAVEPCKMTCLGYGQLKWTFNTAVGYGTRRSPWNSLLNRPPRRPL
jgi:hypothetical protein